MITFKITGTSRLVGAIGIVEPFTQRISAESSHEAYVSARENEYANNRELVNVLKVEADWNDTGEYTPIEPRAYLYT